MKILLFSIILNFYIFNLDLFAQWEQQDSGVSVSLDDVCFIDSMYCWAIGDSATIIAPLDGGSSWLKQVNPEISRKMRKIQFINRNTGYIIGDTGLILKSMNGGLNWQKIESGFTYNYSDISFINETTGWISGSKEEPSTITGVILNTKTGGIQWSKQIEVIADASNGISPIIFTSVDFLNDSTGWALGSDWQDNFSSTHTYFTSNSGNHWEKIGGYESSPFGNLEIISKDTLWASGFIFATSINGGEIWSIPGYDDFFLHPGDIAPINGLRGWAIHNDILSQKKENKVVYTANGGKSWKHELDLSAIYGRAITHIDGKYVWVVGDNGLVIKKSMEVSPVYNHDEFFQEFTLQQNYPNPFNPKTVINYSLPVTCHIELSIYNILGQKVSTLVSKKQTPGQYTVQWDASNLSSGVYYYRMTTDKGFSNIRKMMVLK